MAAERSREHRNKRLAVCQQPQTCQTAQAKFGDYRRISTVTADHAPQAVDATDR